MTAKIRSKIYPGKCDFLFSSYVNCQLFSLPIFVKPFRYLNDLYTLECKGNSYAWEQSIVNGTPPCERESHSCVFYRGQTENRPKLIVYGGMNGHRLGDLWSYHLGKFFFYS